jgi:hypothetical protein
MPHRAIRLHLRATNRARKRRIHRRRSPVPDSSH